MISDGDTPSTLHSTRKFPSVMLSGEDSHRDTCVCDTFMRLATSDCVIPCAACAALSAFRTLPERVSCIVGHHLITEHKRLTGRL